MIGELGALTTLAGSCSRRGAACKALTLEGANHVQEDFAALREPITSSSRRKNSGSKGDG